MYILYTILGILSIGTFTIFGTLFLGGNWRKDSKE